MPDLIPTVYHVDDEHALFIMEDLSRLRMVRRGLIEGSPYPLLAGAVARFSAETVIRTSDYYLPSAEALPAEAPTWRLLHASRAELMRQILRDAAGFAGAEMIRRTIGLARLADLEEIADINVRVSAKAATLVAGRTLLKESAELDHFDQVRDAVMQGLSN